MHITRYKRLATILEWAMRHPECAQRTLNKPLTFNTIREAYFSMLRAHHKHGAMMEVRRVNNLRRMLAP